MAEKLLGSSSSGKVVKTYLILVGMAMRRETTQYGLIAKETGVASQAVGGLCLDPINRYCQANNFPYLTSIVVSKDTGEPGVNYPGARASLYRDREKVYEFPWLDYAPPTIEESDSLSPNGGRHDDQTQAEGERQ